MRLPCLMYACGLRIQEGVSLQVSHIDSARMVVHIHAGKGNKDRCIPLPPIMLDLLRDFWRTHRHPQWLFPGRRNGGGGPLPNATHPMGVRNLQVAFQAVLVECGIRKPATVHTLPGIPARLIRQRI